MRSPAPRGRKKNSDFGYERDRRRTYLTYENCYERDRRRTPSKQRLAAVRKGTCGSGSFVACAKVAATGPVEA